MRHPLMWASAAERARGVLFALRPLWWRPYFHLEVEGLGNLPGRGAFLLCANHTSHLDASAILAALPVHVALGVRTAAAADVWGSIIKRVVAEVVTHSVTVGRGGGFSKGLRGVERVLREGSPVILFPEGRRSPDGAMLPFKCGAAMLAMRAGSPIVPVHIAGAYEALPRTARGVPRMSEVKVRFGRPIEPGGYRLAVEAGWVERHGAYEQMTRDLAAAVRKLGERGRAKPEAVGLENG